MCNDCKETKLEASELKDIAMDLGELKTTSSPSSDSDVIMFFEPLELSTDNLAEDENIQLDKNEFIKGLKDASYVCGMYTALINCGMSMEDSVAYIFNKMNVDHNIESTTINANANIEVSKNVAMSKEKELL